MRLVLSGCLVASSGFSSIQRSTCAILSRSYVQSHWSEWLL